LKRKFLVKIGDKTYPVEVEEIDEATMQAQGARPVVVESPTVAMEVAPRPQAKVEGAPGVIHAPLPGKVVSIKCNVGDNVKAGDTVLVLESMKMENAIMAPKSGKVREISVEEGANVALDDVLLIIE